MSDGEEKLWGTSRRDWIAAYGKDVENIYADRYVMKGEGPALRIAFGMSGAPLNEAGDRADPSYSVAISIPADIALQIAHGILSLVRTVETSVDQADSNRGEP